VLGSSVERAALPVKLATPDERVNDVPAHVRIALTEARTRRRLVASPPGDLGLTWLANIFGGRAAALARRAQRAETQGDLVLAVELYVEAERAEDAARVMILRGDGEAEARARLPHYVQAIATAPEDSPIRRAAREKRALLMIALAGDGALSAAGRHDVLEAARELEDVGKPTEAAAAFARTGNVEGQARALAAAGSVDDLEDLLSEDADRRRRERVHHQAQAEIDLLISCGRRREALELADARLREHPDDFALRERISLLRTRRALGPTLEVRLQTEVGTRTFSLALGAEIIVGRTTGAGVALAVPSHAVSRQHVRIGREPDGTAYVEDLGSRNGTQLHGMNIGGRHPVPKSGDRLSLMLGKEVPLGVRVSSAMADALDIELAGTVFLAPLGAAHLPEGWSLEAAHDGWLELVCEEAIGARAYARDVELAMRTTLLVGDAVAHARGIPAVLEILGARTP
jgi:hypothetical protein